MYGISSSSKNKIYELVDEFFDKMALQLMGEVPSLKNKKSIIFSTKPDMTLAHLFVKSLGANHLLPQEKEAVKNLLSTAEEYVSALRSKTKATLSEKIEAYVREKNAKNERASTSDIKNHITSVLDGARNHFKTIGEAEATKARNLGKVFNISRVATSQNIKDPSVFFVVLRDNKTCKFCVSAHLMPDMITPRVYKLSEVKFGYLTKDERGKAVSISGQHPRCRCSASYLAPNFGFKDGKVSFIGLNHDEYLAQKGIK